MSDQDVWKAIDQAGIRVRQHYNDPAIGWFGVTRWGQCGPFPTREEALTGALRSLLKRIDDIENDSARHKQHTTIDNSLVGILALLRPL